MPFFSIIIPTHNRVVSVQKAIDSVLAQSFKDYEVIVVDDGSDDNTFEELSYKYKDKIKIKKIENSGVSAARNTGIQNSNSPWLCFLDSDDVWLPNKLEEQYEYIINNKNIMINQTDEIWIRNGKRVNPMKKHLKVSGDIFEKSLKLCMITPSSVAIKRDLLNEAGIFDENLPACEDYDLWLRITYNYSVGLIDKKLIIKYGGHSDQLSKRYWGMDRFRVYAICKLLDAIYNDKIFKYNEYKIQLAKSELVEKCRILNIGAKKRNNEDLQNNINKILKWMYSLAEFNNYKDNNSKPYRSLLKL